MGKMRAKVSRITGGGNVKHGIQNGSPGIMIVAQVRVVAMKVASYD